MRLARMGRPKADRWSPLGTELERHGSIVEWMRTYWVALITIGVFIAAIVSIVIIVVLTSRPTTAY